LSWLRFEPGVFKIRIRNANISPPRKVEIYIIFKEKKIVLKYNLTKGLLEKSKLVQCARRPEDMLERNKSPVN
jgi:hypothetical protein